MSIKKSILLLALAAVCVLSSGCNAVRNYSVRSYQGPMPLSEYQFMEVTQHSVPVVRPIATTE
ncbi:MAG: hypothetical protein ACO1QB_19120 [Verrucomicrobiales bacterium]